ncbi:MAG: hypothetical protein Q8O37_00530 [Sulfuricellaceae bacterium]|nr:hypothetical protein [Sulfuricellaceae bacterium]
MTKLDIERAELREFTAGVQAGAARSLDLLRVIESTIDWLARLTRQLSADAEFAGKVNEGLPEISGVIDADGDFEKTLLSAQEVVEQLYEVLIEKRQHGRDDAMLSEDDGVESAYTEAIAASADLHNAINSLRWNIGEHDIDAAPPQLSKSYSAGDIDQMFADLGIL